MTNESSDAVAVDKSQQQQQRRKIEIKVFKRRWLMLGLFTFNGTIVAGQWLQYSIISNIISRYYNVSQAMVDWTTMVSMLSYVVFIFPLTYISEKIGLRWSVVMASALAFLGSWIKVVATSPDLFYVALLGQSVVSLASTMSAPLPGRVAAQWFASDELSTATSLAFFGPQFGDCMTLLLTPMLIKNHDNVDEIEPELYRLFLIVAAAASVNLALITFLFQEEPKIPPNETRALQKINSTVKEEGYVKPMKRLLTNPHYLILLNSYGINVGVLNLFGTLLNQLFLIHFKNGEEDVGRIGLLMSITGIIGSIAFGLILDKTHKFKKTACTIYFFCFCGQILFMVSLLMEVLWMAYASVVVVGIFLYGFPMIGYELSIEYTYPESEVHSAGILNISTCIYGMIFILILQQILECYGDVAAHLILCLLLFIGFILSVLTKDEHRRQDARKSAQCQNLSMNDVKRNCEIHDNNV